MRHRSFDANQHTAGAMVTQREFDQLVRHQASRRGAVAYTGKLLVA
jgi:hypothetical protein